MADESKGFFFGTNIWKSLDTTVVLMLVLITLITFMFLNRRDKRFPPGPPKLPIVGNLFSLASPDPLANFARLREKYGDIYGIYVGKELNIVFNGYDVINDALLKQGTLFSRRPQHSFAKAVVDYVGIVGTNDKLWKEQRGLAINALQSLCLKNGSQHIDRLILTGVNKLLDRLETLDGKPVNLKSYLQVSVAGIITSIILGKFFELDDERFKNYLTFHSGNMAKIPGRLVLINCFSFLLKLPFDAFGLKGLIQSVLTWETFMNERLLDEEADATGNDIIALYQAAIKENEEEALGQSYSRKYMRNTTFDLAIAGSDTTATTINWILLYLLHYPEVENRLHGEIDDVIGRNRPPSLTDRPDLPYMEATILEALRIAAAAPMAVPHSVPHDVIFKGYLIPKDTNILANLHSVHMDPEIWPEPTKFRPERFLSADQKIEIPKQHIPFSIGPRSCLGETLAKMELFLFMASILQRFNLVPVDMASLPPIKGQLGLTFDPEPFEIRLIKR